MEKFIINLLVSILGQMSPVLRESVILWLDDMQKRAAETPNPWDDMFVSFLRILLGAKSDADSGNQTDAGRQG